MKYSDGGINKSKYNLTVLNIKYTINYKNIYSNELF